jgi:ribosomal protein L11 methyltransferase
LVSLRLLDAWEERLTGLPDTTFSVHLPGGKRSARLNLYSASEAPLQAVVRQWGGTLKQGSLRQEIQDSARPFFLRVDSRLIVGSDEKLLAAQTNSKAVPLFVPAGMAFGTGQHATTAMCLRRLGEAMPAGSKGRMLDIGTGTGVLALAASALGWKATAFDNDPEAIRESRRNAARNPQIAPVSWSRADVGSYAPRVSFDVITANLYAEILAEHLPRISEWVAPDGIVIVSGILTEKESLVVRGAKNCQFRIDRRWKTGKWICLRLQKSQKRVQDKFLEAPKAHDPIV